MTNPLLEELRIAKERHYYLLRVFLWGHVTNDKLLIDTYSDKAFKAKTKIKELERQLSTPVSQAKTFILNAYD